MRLSHHLRSRRCGARQRRVHFLQQRAHRMLPTLLNTARMHYKRKLKRPLSAWKLSRSKLTLFVRG